MTLEKHYWVFDIQTEAYLHILNAPYIPRMGDVLVFKRRCAGWEVIHIRQNFYTMAAHKGQGFSGYPETQIYVQPSEPCPVKDCNHGLVMDSEEE